VAPSLQSYPHDAAVSQPRSEPLRTWSIYGAARAQAAANRRKAGPPGNGSAKPIPSPALADGCVDRSSQSDQLHSASHSNSLGPAHCALSRCPHRGSTRSKEHCNVLPQTRPLSSPPASRPLRSPGTYGIVNATSSSSPTAASAATPPPAFRGAGSGGSNARSGPAAGGSIGTVSDISTSGFTLVTSAGQKVTVEEMSSTAYKKGTTATAASAVTPGQTALVIGTVDSTTITAAKVILQPPASASKTVSPVVPFTRGAASTAKSVGQIPANYRQGSGTIVGGTTASKATQAALAAYPGGIADRVVRLSNGEYEVHNIGSTGRITSSSARTSRCSEPISNRARRVREHDPPDFTSEWRTTANGPRLRRRPRACHQWLGGGAAAECSPHYPRYVAVSCRSRRSVARSPPAGGIGDRGRPTHCR
jgi:hypothetical protein